MVIEQLTFRVPPDKQAHFLSMDATIWTQALAAQPGYLGKEVWREAADPAVLNLIIRWASRGDWHAVNRGLLAETDRRFCAAVGAVYPVLRCLDQDVV